jgi:hypothetical protein
LQALVESVVAQLATPVEHDDASDDNPLPAGAWLHRLDRDEIAEVARAVRRRRTEPTTARLQKVAEIYAAAGAKEVARRLHLSQSQAFRLVQKARDAGLVPESLRRVRWRPEPEC